MKTEVSRDLYSRRPLDEGWDCLFAYILALLDTTAAPGALTQMTGRILRQPDAKKTGTILDNAHVFCFNHEVGETVRQIKKGLEKEGMPDLKRMVDGGETGEKPAKRAKTVKRREEFAGRQIFLPRVLHCRKGKLRPLDYEADILRHVDWRGISESDLGLTLAKVDGMAETLVEVGFSGRRGKSETRDLEAEKKLSPAFFARCLGDVIPNPWLAADAAKRALGSLRNLLPEDADKESELFDRRFRIAEAMKEGVAALVDRGSKRVFCEKLGKGEILLELTAGEGFDFELREETEAMIEAGESLLMNDDGDPLERSLYRRVYQDGFDSNLEREFAVYVDGHNAVSWWHRLAANRGGGYGLQGWRPHRVYPDFVVCVGDNDEARVLVLETKGMHLDNPDTEYKRALLERLSATNPRALVECGGFTLKSGKRERRMVLRVLLEKGWKEEFEKLAAE